MILKITISRKLFHSDQASPLGVIRTRVDSECRGKVHKFKLGDLSAIAALMKYPVPVSVLRPVVRRHIHEWLKDRTYSVFWDEDTGVQTEVLEDSRG